MSDPELIEQLQPREARFQKIDRSFSHFLFLRHDRGFFFWRRQPRNFENVILVARRREHFPEFWGDPLLTQGFTRVLSTGVVTALSHAPSRVLSNKVIWVLGHCWINTPHIHTSEWDSLLFQSCLLSTITVTPSVSDYVNRRAPF